MVNRIDLNDLGCRICILGRSCGGKSTLAHSLGEKLNIPVLHLDQIAHIPHTNWERRNHEEFVADHDHFIEHDKWIVEGNYSMCMPQRLERANAVIFMDFSFHDYLWRYLKRVFQTKFQPKKRIGAIEGAKKEFNWSLIQYVWRMHPKNRAKYHDYLDIYMKDKPVIILRCFSDLDKLYAEWALKKYF